MTQLKHLKLLGQNGERSLKPVSNIKDFKDTLPLINRNIQMAYGNISQHTGILNSHDHIHQFIRQVGRKLQYPGKGLANIYRQGLHLRAVLDYVMNRLHPSLYIRLGGRYLHKPGPGNALYYELGMPLFILGHAQDKTYRAHVIQVRDPAFLSLPVLIALMLLLCKNRNGTIGCKGVIYHLYKVRRLNNPRHHHVREKNHVPARKNGYLLYGIHDLVFPFVPGIKGSRVIFSYLFRVIAVFFYIHIHKLNLFLLNLNDNTSRTRHGPLDTITLP